MSSVQNETLEASGKETLVITGSVARLTPPKGTKYALIYVESNVASGYAIRYWEDGSTPTTTEGIPRSADTAFDITGLQNITKLRITQAQAGTHTLQIQYYN